MHLLLIDDDKLQIQIIQKAFKKSMPECKLYSANDGIEALENLSIMKFDLILLDLSMPKMNGYDFIKSLEVKNINIPYIVISGKLDGSAINKLYASGATDCLKKPFYLEQLINKVRKFI